MPISSLLEVHKEKSSVSVLSVSGTVLEVSALVEKYFNERAELVKVKFPRDEQREDRRTAGELPEDCRRTAGELPKDDRRTEQQLFFAAVERSRLCC